MKYAILLFVITVLAADVVNIGVVTETEGLRIVHCHEGDRAMIEVTPVNPAPDRVAGMFETTNVLITMKHPAMTMAPTGTNLAKIRTICSGSTSEVREVRFVIRRTMPAPKVRRGTSVVAQTPMPPMPPGMVMPLPGGSSEDYGQYLKRLERVRKEGLRRNQ